MTVEFLPEDGPVEEQRPAPPRRPGRWWVLGAALVAAIAVGVVVRSGGDNPPPTAAKTASPSRSIVRPLGTADPSDRADRACRGAAFCQARLAIPPAVGAAVRRYLPAPITSLQVTTYVAQTQTTRTLYVAERDIKATIGSVSVLIVVGVQRGSASRPSAIVSAPPGVGSVLVHAVRSEYVIDLQYLAPETVPPDLAKLGRLTKDPVLERL